MFFFPPGIPPDVYDNYCLKMQQEKKLRKQKDELETLRQHISKTPSVSLNTMMAYGMLYTEIQKIKKLNYFYFKPVIVIRTNSMETERSFLKFQEFPDKELLEKCVADVTDNVEINPPLRRMFGKECFMRRGVGFFSDESIGYPYSGQLAASRPMTSSLLALLALVNSIYGTEYNGILVNKYFNGQDYISAHSDDEENLDDSGVVAISWGEKRRFRIRKKGEKGYQDFPMVSGSMLQMGGDFQSEFTHEIPRETKVDGVRISFTFRKHTV